ncbi:hypothetical protein [Ottowia thiooxydans]|uniref:Uncharacterized protein n=1 Tax=Ottowia thiooxydans TaxID=219182 RepID=A0ABV2QD12_9BURK
MRIKRVLHYCILPVLLVLALVGFPMPIGARQAVKPSQEQSAPADKRD